MEEPDGLVEFDGPLSAEQVAEFKTRWRAVAGWADDDPIGGDRG